MAGPAIRCVELARQLGNEFSVTVFTPRPTDIPDEKLKQESYTLIAGAGRRRLYNIARDHDVVFLQANVLKPYPGLAKLGKYLIVDLYDPYLMALLAQYADDPVTASASYRLMHQVLEKHMIKADFSVCASERQRDYWLGRYCCLGRLTPEMYDFDASFRKLIDVVPFGVPDIEPERTGPGMKDVVPGIGPDDTVLLWGGGVWEWFDPITVIEATARLTDSHPRLRLFFMGLKSPNPQVPLMEMAVRAEARAKKLGVLNKSVFFSKEWIPYEKRVNYLPDADIAVSAHFDLPETRFSFRTRVLDYLWAGLPILTTGGDQLAESITSYSAGMALPYKDVNAWADAISRLLSDEERRGAFAEGARKLSRNYLWNKAAEPVRSFCRNPYHPPEYKKVTMPNLVERAHSVYVRGGKELVYERSKSLFEELIKH